MRIGIVGAGLGGLAAAAGLAADGHEVRVFERRASPGAVGAGLTLFPNSFEALDEIGLGDRIRSISDEALSLMTTGQRMPSGQWLVRLPPSARPAVRAMHRAEVHRALIETLPMGTVRLGANAVVTTDGAPIVTVDSDSETFDLVIAADGIRSESRVRLGLDRGVRYAGYTAWRGVTSIVTDVAGGATETWGRGQTFGIVPLPDRRTYWFATRSTAPGDSSHDERAAVLELFAGWHAPIRSIIESTAAKAVLRHDVFDLTRLPRSFVTGRTALLGDAAHGMTPNLGQGAGQAVEDAVTLVLLLRGGDIDAALARYDELRRARTRTMWARSRLAGRVAQLSHPVFAALRDTLLRVTPPAVIAGSAKRLSQWAAP